MRSVQSFSLKQGLRRAGGLLSKNFALMLMIKRLSEGVHSCARILINHFSGLKPSYIAPDWNHSLTRFSSLPAYPRGNDDVPLSPLAKQRAHNLFNLQGTGGRA
jgi:hypothetical protein